MKRFLFNIWSLAKFTIIIVILGIIFCLFKYPNDSKKYAKQAYSYIMSNDSSITIPLETDDSGVFYITAKLNDVPLRFILDTGCSTMLISNKDAEFLMQHKIIHEKNIMGDVQSICANGNIETHINVNIEQIELGGIYLTDIPCMVSNSPNAPSLLGQVILSQLGKIIIDYENKLLIIKK